MSRVPTIKIMIQKLKNTIKRNIDYCAAIENKNDFNFMGGQEQRRKIKRNVAPDGQKRYDFIDIWFRQMLVQHLKSHITHQRG